MLPHEQVAALLKAFFQKAPQMAKYFGVNLDASGEPVAQELQKAVAERVMLQTKLQ